MKTLNVLMGFAFVTAFCTMSPAIAQTDEAKPFDVGRQFNCKACHVNRLTEIRKNEQPTLIAPASIGNEAYGEQDSSSTQRMCLSCHDGFVEDSRLVWNGEHVTHPVGVALQEGMEIPLAGKKLMLPLNEEDEVYCGTCHLGHPGKGIHLRIG